MNETVVAIEITIVSMALVFGAIILLWGLMSALVNLLARKNEPAPIEVPLAAPADDDEGLLKQRAAVAAVTVALAQARKQTAPCTLSMPPTTALSPWQSVMRTRNLKQKRSVR